VKFSLLAPKSSQSWIAYSSASSSKEVAFNISATCSWKSLRFQRAVQGTPPEA
jgi:hypothetical protein